MPTVTLSDTSIYYDTHGQGNSLLLLHAGWGRPVNNFELQMEALSGRFHLLMPDRRGYGRSARIDALPIDFHRQAAADMLAVLDHATVDEAWVWGHSDGAVVGAWMAILAPQRVRALVFEGGHLYARKQASRGRALMERVSERPESLPAEMQTALADWHGVDYWKRLLWMWTEAWRLLYERGGDLYDGRLGEIQCPVLVVHGGQDPHTSLDEVQELADRIPHSSTLFVPEAGHCLHDDPAVVDRVHTAVLQHFKPFPPESRYTA